MSDHHLPWLVAASVAVIVLGAVLAFTTGAVAVKVDLPAAEAPR